MNNFMNVFVHGNNECCYAVVEAVLNKGFTPYFYGRKVNENIKETTR